MNNEESVILSLVYQANICTTHSRFSSFAWFGGNSIYICIYIYIYINHKATHTNYVFGVKAAGGMVVFRCLKGIFLPFTHLKYILEQFYGNSISSHIFSEEYIMYKPFTPLLICLFLGIISRSTQNRNVYYTANAQVLFPVRNTHNWLHKQAFGVYSDVFQFGNGETEAAGNISISSVMTPPHMSQKYHHLETLKPLSVLAR